jgi:hypothetical protein
MKDAMVVLGGLWWHERTVGENRKMLPFRPFRWSAIVDCDLKKELVLFFPKAKLLSHVGFYVFWYNALSQI